MKFGDFLKQKREKEELTQPIVAQKIGIEQSYLSKLETGKSFPSQDVFARLQNVYNFNDTDVLNQVSNEELSKLSDVKNIREELVKVAGKGKRQNNRWLLTAFICLIISGAFFGSFVVGNSLQETFYYRSLGVLNENDLASAFDRTQQQFYSEKNFYDFHQEQKTMLKRLDIIDRVHTDFKGENYTEVL